jgi:hypothetical protein
MTEEALAHNPSRRKWGWIFVIILVVEICAYIFLHTSIVASAPDRWSMSEQLEALQRALWLIFLPLGLVCLVLAIIGFRPRKAD